jgi:NRPS condensation-like uncharacterized protein
MEKSIPIGIGDIILYLMSRYTGDQYIYTFVELDGRFDRDKLLNSLRRLIVKIPALRSILRLDRVPAVFEPQTNFDFEPCLSYFEESDKAEADDRHRLFCAQIINPERETPLRALLQNYKNKSRLALMVHHTVYDGAGAKETIRQLADCYSTERGQNPKDEIQLDANRSHLPLWKSISSREWFKLLGVFLKDAPKLKTNDPRTPLYMDGDLPDDKAGVEKPRFLTGALEGDNFKALRNFGKKNGYTVNDHICGALLSAARSWNIEHGADRAFYPLSHTVDLRALAPDSTGTFANHSSAATMPVSADLIGDLEQTLLVVKPLLDEAKKKNLGMVSQLLARIGNLGMPLPLCIPLLSPSFKLMGKFTRRYFMFTNIGVLDSSAAAWGELRATKIFISGPAMPPRSFLVSVLGFADALNFVFAFDGVAMSDPLANQFIDHFLKRLMAFER